MSDERSPRGGRDEHQDAHKDEDVVGDDTYYVRFKKRDNDGERMKRWRQ